MEVKRKMRFIPNLRSGEGRRLQGECDFQAERLKDEWGVGFP